MKYMMIMLLVIFFLIKVVKGEEEIMYIIGQ
jgi:hypothetical protein